MAEYEEAQDVLSTCDALLQDPSEVSKKKKKRKPKKKASKDAPTSQPSPASQHVQPFGTRLTPKGPWLQLPVELLDSLSVLNQNPASFMTPDIRSPLFSHKHRDRDVDTFGEDAFDLGSIHAAQSHHNAMISSLYPSKDPGKPTPPPIDPNVFNGVAAIRRLVDEAAELSVRASSGLSAAALGNIHGIGMPMGNMWARNGMGMRGMQPERQATMSAMRIHRLRALAVQKLSQAYKLDEIASSVMVMQSSGSLFDDIAERVLKVDPDDVDARYVHFFHEKIPSRQLAESTTTQALDALIAAQPYRLEFYRTRGIVHCFREEFARATKDFTHAIKEAKAMRRVKQMHDHSGLNVKKKKGKKSAVFDQEGASPSMDLVLHPNLKLDAPDPIEAQCLFYRGSAYFHHAIFIIEEAILKLEGVPKMPPADGSDLRLSRLEGSRYGGVEQAHTDGPLGKRGAEKQLAYRRILAEDDGLREQVFALIKKSIRDHERFQSHFDSLVAPDTFPGDIAQRVQTAFLICESMRPGPNGPPTPPPGVILPEGPGTFTTYHPLLVESYFSVLIGLLVLGDFQTILPTFSRTASIVDGLEGYPIFLPPRSMAQAEFIETLDRLVRCWKNGLEPHSLSKAFSKRLAIEAPSTPPSNSTSSLSSPTEFTFDDFEHAGSSATASSSHRPSQTNSLSEIVTPPPLSFINSPYSLMESLDCARILLAPVSARQRDIKDKANKKLNGTNNLHIPLHGPRVDVILAWMGAVHLFELDTVAADEF